MEFIDNMTRLFYQNFNSWIRLEPRARQNDVAEGLAARIADPLWMLFRQKQMGEFQAEDAGSAVRADVEYRTVPMETSFSSSLGFLEKSPPLEAIVEQKVFPITWKERIRIGQQFERLVKAEFDEVQMKRIINEFRTTFPITDELEFDVETNNFLRVMKGKAIDGERLLRAAKNDFHLFEEELQDIKDKLLVWYDELYFQPEQDDQTTWNDQQLEYRFDAKFQGDFKLKAPSYRNGELDWYTCDSTEEHFEPVVSRSFSQYLPTRVSFAGMPNHRWWSFEDNQVNFANFDVATTDLAKTLLMEFALIYGNDWLVVPLELELGSLTNVSEIIVHDVFGAKTKIKPPQDLSTKLFSPYMLQGSNLFLPPVTNHREESLPIEEIRFMRDEGANMVWAIENRVLNDLGNSVSAFDLYGKQNLQPAAFGDGDNNLPAYRLASSIPANWIPYIPVNNSKKVDEVSVKLRRARMDTKNNISAKSLSLKGDDMDLINEEAIPRSGVKLQLTKQRVRWIDGKTYVWFGRKVVTGRGEGNSGLRFDYLDGGR